VCHDQQKLITFVRILCASCSNFPFSWNLKWRLPLAEPLLLWQQKTSINCINQTTASWRTIGQCESSNPQCLNKDWPIRTHHCFYINNIIPVPRPTNSSVQISSLLLYSRFLTSFLCVSIPFCPQLPILVQQSHHHLPNRVAFEFFSLLLVYLSFCLQYFHAKVHCVSKHG